MQIKITTKELEYAAQKYVKQEIKFDIVDEKTVIIWLWLKNSKK